MTRLAKKKAIERRGLNAKRYKLIASEIWLEVVGTTKAESSYEPDIVLCYRMEEYVSSRQDRLMEVLT